LLCWKRIIPGIIQNANVQTVTFNSVTPASAANALIPRLTYDADRHVFMVELENTSTDVVTADVASFDVTYGYVPIASDKYFIYTPATVTTATVTIPGNGGSYGIDGDYDGFNLFNIRRVRKCRTPFYFANPPEAVPYLDVAYTEPSSASEHNYVIITNNYHTDVQFSKFFSELWLEASGPTSNFNVFYDEFIYTSLSIGPDGWVMLGTGDLDTPSYGIKSLFITYDQMTLNHDCAIVRDKTYDLKYIFFYAPDMAGQPITNIKIVVEYYNKVFAS
jgi:hypothetical protein